MTSQPSSNNWVARLLTGLGYVLLIPLFPLAVKIVQEYERGVIFRLGRLVGAKGPGLFIILPIVDRMVKMDLRVFTVDVPSQEMITTDNVTVKVDAVMYFRVVDPEDAVVKVENYFRATALIAQTTLRSTIGQSDLDALLAKREEINQRLQVAVANSRPRRSCPRRAASLLPHLAPCSSATCRP